MDDPTSGANSIIMLCVVGTVAATFIAIVITDFILQRRKHGRRISSATATGQSVESRLLDSFFRPRRSKAKPRRRR